MSNIIKVGMADYKIANRPDSLTTLGLGSCVGICLYDCKTGCIGMAHIMLPDSNAVRDSENKAKFADTAIPIMFELMLKSGCIKSNILAKIAGGAQMFSYTSENDLMKVGERNVEATKAALKKLGIPILAQDTGGNCGRTIELRGEDGVLVIKTVGKEIKTY